MKYYQKTFLLKIFQVYFLEILADACGFKINPERPLSVIISLIIFYTKKKNNNTKLNKGYAALWIAEYAIKSSKLEAGLHF